MSFDPIPRGTRRALLDVAMERERQDTKWGREQGKWYELPGCRYLVLAEEVGEVARALLEREPLHQLRAELVQVAAVCVSWIETIDAENERLHVTREHVLRRIKDEMSDSLLGITDNTFRERATNLVQGIFNRISALL